MKLLLSALIGTASAMAFAQPIQLKMTDGYELAVQYSDYKYEEPNLMNNTGRKYGAEVIANKVLNDDYFLSGSVRYAFGDVKYTGSGTADGKSDSLWDLRLVGAKDLAFETYVLAPYIGIGYRTLFNDLRGTTSTGALGYRRNSEYVYIPIGFQHRFKLDDKSRITTVLEYDYLASGQQTTFLSDVSASHAAIFGDPINNQKNGYGSRLSVSYEENTWSVGVFYNYWNIADSETNYYTSGGTTYSLKEPENNTNEFGIQVKYRF